MELPAPPHRGTPRGERRDGVGAHTSTAPGWHGHTNPGARGAVSCELYPQQHEHHAPLATTTPPLWQAGAQRYHSSYLPMREPPCNQPPLVPAMGLSGMPTLWKDPQPGREKAHGAKLILPLAPAHKPPCQHKHSACQPAWLTWKMQHRPSQILALPATGQDVGQEGPVPHLQYAGIGAVP